jgi:hypothetical protein
MTKREEIKDKYKTGAAFVADISKRTMLILQELNAFLDENEEDLFDDDDENDISVSDYFSLYSLREKLQDLVDENK